MIGHVIELLAANGHIQASHMREVALALPAGFIDLWKHDFALRSGSNPPLFEPSLQGAQLTFLELSRVLATQMPEHRLRLHGRMVAQNLLHLGPHRFKRVRSGSPLSGLPHLAGHLVGPPVLPRRLLVHSRFRGRLGQRRLALCQLHQSSHLLIRYHPSILQNQ